MKQIFKFSMMAALLAGSVTAVQAANNATLNISGKIAKTSCAVSIDQGLNDLNLGTWLPSDFNVGAPLAGSAKSTTVAFQNCAGSDVVATTGSILLKAEPVTQDSSLAAAGLWGDGVEVSNVGIYLTAQSPVIGTSAQALTPNANTVAVYKNTTATGQAVTGVTIPPVKLTAALQSTAAVTQYGNVKSSIILSAYQE